MTRFETLLAASKTTLQRWYDYDGDPKELTMFFYFNGKSYHSITYYKDGNNKSLIGKFCLVTGGWELLPLTDGLIIEIIQYL